MKSQSRFRHTMLFVFSGLTFFPLLADLPPGPDFSEVEKRVQEEINSLRQDAESKAAKNGSQVTPGNIYSAQQESTLLNIQSAIAVLKVQVEEGKLDGIDQQLSLAYRANLSPELSPLIESLKIALENYVIEVGKSRQKEKFRHVDELLKETKNLIEENGNVNGFEALLVKITALGTEGLERNADPVAKRYYEKMSGLSSTVQSWLRYKDFVETGNVEQAGAQLEQLSKSASFPVVDRATINKALRNLPLESQNVDVALQLGKSLKGPQDIPGVLEEIENLELTLRPNSSHNSKISTFKQQLTDLASAWKNLENGNGEFAMSILRSNHFSNIRRSDNFLGSIVLEIESRYLLKAGLIVDGVEHGEGEGARFYLSRVFKLQLQQEKYQEALVTANQMELFLDRQLLPADFRSNLDATKAYVTGRSLEEAGDFLMALLNYRKCLAAQGSVEGPGSAAKERISRLSKEHPEIMTSIEGAVMERLDDIDRRLEIPNFRRR